MKSLFRRTFVLWSLITGIIILMSIPARSSEYEVRKSAFSLITCSPGPDLYSLFGHSAFRFNDTIQGRAVDWVYNYGTFHFDEDFYWKFSTGKLDYILSKSDYSNFVLEYERTGRGVVEQPLLLSDEEEWQLLVLLEENYRPENRTYRYDFFYDNCSTRIRDMLQKALGNDVNYSYRGPGGITYRRAIQSYLDYMPWSDFGIDLALGLPCDEEMLVGGEMFLPDSLYKNLNYALHNGSELSSGEKELLPRLFELSSGDWLTPINVFLGFLILQVFLGLYFLKKKRTIILPDRILFFVSGLIGALIVFLWFFTDHAATKWNFNMVWALPVNLVFAFISFKRNWQRLLLKFYALILTVFMMAWFMLPQQMNLACLPLILGLLFICIKVYQPGALVKEAR